MSLVLWLVLWFSTVRIYCAVSVGQNRNPDTRKPSRLKISDFADRHRSVDPDSAVRRCLPVTISELSEIKNLFSDIDPDGYSMFYIWLLTCIAFASILLY